MQGSTVGDFKGRFVGAYWDCLLLYLFGGNMHAFHIVFSIDVVDLVVPCSHPHFFYLRHGFSEACSFTVLEPYPFFPFPFFDGLDLNHTIWWGKMRSFHLVPCCTFYRASLNTSSKANKNYLYLWVRSKEECFNVHSHLFSHNLAICMHIKKVISSDISPANYYPPL